ncbi:hypothetical protein AB0230_09025 [Microbacterium sp. NPDC089190]|uniref:hypothetical protein n=1 Tax=Microbacterium sp. NPDC089190 TaxID=3155063 RepID=UPI0034511135
MSESPATSMRTLSSPFRSTSTVPGRAVGVGVGVVVDVGVGVGVRVADALGRGDADAAGAVSGAFRPAEITTAATPTTAATATTLIVTVQAARGRNEGLSPRCR